MKFRTLPFLASVISATVALGCGDKGPPPTPAASPIATPVPAPTKAAKAPTPTAAYKDLDAAEFKRLAAERGGILLDVRTPGEIQRAAIANASVIDIRDPRFEQKAGMMQKDKPIFVYCASGGRSAGAAQILTQLGFGEVYNLRGGIRAWMAAGFAVEQGEPSNEASADGMSPENFDKLVASNALLLVDFHTQWCAPCKKMAPIVDQLAKDYKGKAEVVRIDIDQSEQLASREQVQQVPVLVVYRDGKETWRHTGELARDAIEAQLTSAAN